MKRHRDRLLFLLGVLLTAPGAAGCGAATPAAEEGLPLERRAALAHLVVDNRTPHRLAIAFTYAVETGGAIVLGEVDGGTIREMPPIPATEPIVLTARADGFERRLEPRSFEIDETWTWVIEPEDG